MSRQRDSSWWTAEAIKVLRKVFVFTPLDPVLWSHVARAQSPVLSLMKGTLPTGSH
jgi:hypothetical protein